MNVFTTDAELIEAISTGQCAIGFAGSNALAAHISANADSQVAFHQFADPAGAVVEASGGGVSRHASNPEGAADLLVWLTSNAPNALYAAQGHQFPANDASSAAPGIDPWREAVSEPTPLSDLAFLHDEAVLLVQRARYP
jgi:iron(III) transport system substrate-binding protein